MLLAQGGALSADGKWVTMPDGTDVSLSPMALSDCPSGSVCLFENANFTGTLVKWTAAGTRADLSALSFNDEMTSWANKSAYDAKWFYNAGFAGTSRCMQPGTSNANVGGTDNDQASSLAIYTDALAC